MKMVGAEEPMAYLMIIFKDGRYFPIRLSVCIFEYGTDQEEASRVF